MARRKSRADRIAAVTLAGERRIATAHGQWEREVLDMPDGSRTSVVRMFDNDPLELMARRGMISLAQLGWGERLWRDWYEAGAAASGVVDMERPVVDRTPDYEAAMVRQGDAMRRYALALKAVGPIHSAALCAVVLEGQPLEAWGARRFGRNADRKARDMAQGAVVSALDALGIHYNGR